ncbi:MAG: trypsin-like peptidase domain-containing protein [Candidatus Limnocylindrales bacterium]
MPQRDDRTAQRERLARLADGPRPAPDAAGVAADAPPPSPTRRRRMRSTLGRVAPFATGVLAVLVALAMYGAVTPRETPLTTTDIDQRVGAALASQVPGPPFSALAFGVIVPSLVHIETGSDEPLAGLGEGTDELGSGVVVSDDGVILTALHVVDGADTIDLTFANGATAEGYVVEEQPEKDIAIIQVDQLPEGVGPAVLGDPGLPVGSEAYAVGSPYGLFGSLSAGVISGRDRSFRAPDSGVTITGLIQFDAAVNPGNSGGPLLDRGGRVVAIVIALLNPTDAETFTGIGLAVPIDAAGGDGALPPY